MADTSPVEGVVAGGEDGDTASDTNSRREDGLPTNFDVLIVGTGLVESIVSAAVSRNGHTVLHIDPREYYGGVWATFGLDQWMSASFMETPMEALNSVNVFKEDAQYGKLNWRNHVNSFEQHWYSTNEDVKNELTKQRRRFNIDLMPKLIAAREEIVQLLIKSNVSRYLEFLRITRLLTNLPPPNENTIEPIPLSRADIFTTKSLTLVEKRSLVKMIEAVLKCQKTETEENLEGELEEHRQQPPETFEELVQTIKASEKIKHLLKSSITTLEDGFSPNGERFNREFCTRCRLFLNSIGRYGNQTPFLWTLYGISEICQAFCRLSAVYGGIFILKRHLSEIKTLDTGFVIKTEDDEIKAKHVIIGPDFELDSSTKLSSRKEHHSVQIGRAVLVTRGGNIKVPDENPKIKGDGIFLYRLSEMEIIEMNHTSQAVPKDYRLIHVSFPVLEEGSPSYCKNLVEEKLSAFLDFYPPPVTASNAPTAEGDPLATHESEASPNATLEGTSATPQPQVLYGSYFLLDFSCSNVSSELLTTKKDSNTNYILESNVASTDLTNYVTKAQQIFSTIFPDEEFLPKAPDCDDQSDMNGDSDDASEIPSPTSSGGDSNAQSTDASTTDS